MTNAHGEKAGICPPRGIDLKAIVLLCLHGDTRQSGTTFWVDPREKLIAIQMIQTKANAGGPYRRASGRRA
jgi:hypothetical protein